MQRVVVHSPTVCYADCGPQLTGTQIPAPASLAQEGCATRQATISGVVRGPTGTPPG